MRRAQLLFATACLMSSWPIKLVVAKTIVPWTALQLPIAEVLLRTYFCSYGVETC